MNDNLTPAPIEVLASPPFARKEAKDGAPSVWASEVLERQGAPPALNDSWMREFFETRSSWGLETPTTAGLETGATNAHFGEWRYERALETGASDAVSEERR